MSISGIFASKPPRAILEFVIMSAHWVNLCEREPAENMEVQVIVVRGSGDGAYDVEYELATLTPRGWRFDGTPKFTRVVAWLESERVLDREELARVTKDNLRF